MVDPDNETTASTCISTSSTLGYAWQIPYMVVGSLMIFTMPTITTVISVALLLFFLIISTMVTPVALKVMLPHSSTAEKVITKKNIMLAVTADRQYFIDDRKVEFKEIEPALASMVKNKKEGNAEIEYVVLLQADMSLNLQPVVDLIDIANRLQLKMLLFVEKK